MEETQVIVQKEGNYIEFRQEIDGGFIITLIILSTFSTALIVGSIAILFKVIRNG